MSQVITSQLNQAEPSAQDLTVTNANEQTTVEKQFWQSQIKNAQNVRQFNFPEILQTQKQHSRDKLLGWYIRLAITPSAYSTPTETLGCRVAASALTEAILRYSSLNSYHFLGGLDSQHKHCSNSEIKDYLCSLGVDPDCVAAFDVTDNAHYLSRVEYHAVHVPGPDIIHAARLRHSIRGHVLPITGMTHTLSYANLMPLWFELLMADLLPCDTIICTSRAARRVLETTFAQLSDRLAPSVHCDELTFKGRLEVIPLGVDSGYWQPCEDKSRVRKQLGLSPKQCIILCAARFSVHDKMDLTPLLIAIRQLADKYQDQRFQLILAGDVSPKHWNYAVRVRELIHTLGLTETVRLETSLAPAVMKLLFQGADIFVSLSDNIQETFGLTVLEAMACALPVVVSDWDGYRDTVVHEETGFRARTLWTQCEKHISGLASCRTTMKNHLFLAQTVAVDLDQTVEYLDALITNPDLRTQMGNSARQRVEQTFAWPVIVKQYERLWDDCQKMIKGLDRTTLSRVGTSDIFNPSYFSRFSHYASMLLRDDTLLAVTDIGIELMSQSDVLNRILCCDEMRYVLCAPVFARLAHRMEQTTVVNLGELLSCTVETMPMPSELVLRHIMWLIKYGALRIMEPMDVYN